MQTILLNSMCTNAVWVLFASMRDADVHAGVQPLHSMLQASLVMWNILTSGMFLMSGVHHQRNFSM